MAEKAHYHLEQTLPSLQLYSQRGIFDANELALITKQRTTHEYAIAKRIQQKIDYVDAIEYEVKLGMLVEERIKRLKLKDGGGVVKAQAVKRIFNLYARSVRKFHGDKALWMDYLKYAKKQKANKYVTRIITQALRYHPMTKEFWCEAVAWEFEHNGDMTAARRMIQRAIRMNSTTKSLYFEFFKLELLWVEKMRQRAQLMKLPSSEILQDNDSTEKTTIKLATLTNEEESKIIPPIETMEDDKKDAVGSELLLAQAVYRNTIAQFPGDLLLRLEMLETAQKFPNTLSLQEYILHDLDSFESVKKQDNSLATE